VLRLRNCGIERDQGVRSRGFRQVKGVVLPRSHLGALLATAGLGGEHGEEVFPRTGIVVFNVRRQSVP
jgi:hypothetical protein